MRFVREIRFACEMRCGAQAEYFTCNLPQFYAIMSAANSINSYLEKSNEGIDILITERRWS